MPRTVALWILLAGCGSVSKDDDDPADTTPPSVVSVAPADGAVDVWLHDPIRIALSEPIDDRTLGGVHVVGPDSVPLAAAVALVSPSELVVRVEPEVAVVGQVRVVLDDTIVDLAGNPLVATSIGWTIAPWTRDEVRGTTPAIAIDAAGAIVVARALDGSSGRRIAVRRRDGLAWRELGGSLGARDSALPAVAFDRDGTSPVVAWSELGTPSSIEAARWTGEAWAPLPSPGPGSFAVIAATPGGPPMVAFTAAVGTTTLLRVRVLAGDHWDAVGPDLAVDGGVVGLPQLAVTAAGLPIVAFVDTGRGGPAIRIARGTGAAWQEVAPIPLGPLPVNDLYRVSIAERAGQLVVAYDALAGSFGVHAVAVTGTAWKPLGDALDVDPSADAQAPAVAIDDQGAPIVAWREQIDGNWRGVLARWDGARWTELGGHAWSDDPARPLVRPTLALHRGRVPVVAWFEGSPEVDPGPSVRVARFNGPRVAPLRTQRASLAGCAFDGTAATLSATGCFAIARGRATAHPGLIPFDVISELWSDGALKRRWVALPDGQALTTPPTGAWTAPVGTFVIKEFALETTPRDARTRRAMETRFLLEVSAGTWQGFSYRWRADGSDADLLPDTGTTVPWRLDDGTTHVHSYPSRRDCARCHHPSNGPLLGLRTAQLARRIDDGGVIVDQLAALRSLGAIPAQPAVAPFASPHDPTDSLENRVRGYLAANCSHCHNPAGERPTRDFRWETPLDQTHLCGPDSEVIAGNPAASVIVQRISTRTNGMPPLATLELDPLAIDAVTRWIASETSCP